MIKKITPLILTAFVVIGCAKKESFEEVFKEAEVSKKDAFFTPFSGSQLGAAGAFSNESTSKLKKGMSKKYLYVPMTLGTPREVADANPFYQGDTKLVRMQFTEAGLEVFEIEKDERFSDNDLNNTPVLTIPGDHLAYQCKEDANGKCSNEEEENSELTWDQKDHFKPNYGELEVKEVNFLDLVNIEGSECVIPNGVKLVDYEVKKDDVINIELEKTYKLNKSWRCIRSNYYNDKFSYNSFKVRFFYSLVALDSIASKNYEPLKYPKLDHSVFGLFKTEKKKLNDVFDTQRLDTTYLANRWNPKKDILTYYLSASYSKPQNKAILDATMKSMEVMNKNLASAGVNFKLNFIKQTKENEKSPGDLRYNSIVLIDDPLANGLLGYAPSVKNPETGEIVQSHINMYGGVLASGTRWVYEGAVDIMEAKAKAKQSSNAVKVTMAEDAIKSEVIPSIIVNSSIESTGINKPVAAKQGIALNGEVGLRRPISDIMIDDHAAHNHQAMVKEGLRKETDRKFHFDQIMSGAVKAKDIVAQSIIEDNLKTNGYHLSGKAEVEFFPIAGTTKAIYPGLLKIKGAVYTSGPKTGILKRWDLLNNEQKAKAREVIMVNRYVSTFVHEMGHSLGLRHNFAGSTDSDNFYSDAQVRSILGDEEAKAPAYSSVMDYAFSEYNELASFGKYDVNALRYSYTGNVIDGNNNILSITKGSAVNSFKADYNKKLDDEIVNMFNAADFSQIPREVTDLSEPAESSFAVNGELNVIEDFLSKPASAEIANRAEILSTIKDIRSIEKKKIIDFAFCTDDNAGLSSTCNRFDEGSNPVEIVKFRISKYKTWYKYRNYRDGRDQFSTYDLPAYLNARYSEFGLIRDTLENYELYADAYGDELLASGCGEADSLKYPDACKNIKEIGEAAILAGEFFLDILKTPDHLCAVAKKDAPTVIVEFKKLKDLFTSARGETSKDYISSCYDSAIKKILADNKTSEVVEGRRVTKSDPLVVVGENGKFLNSIRGFDPENNVSSDRSVRGIWIDKVLAMRMLYERTHFIGGTDTNFKALVDIPVIKEKVNNFIKHLTIGTPIDKPLPFVTENGDTFTAPYFVGVNDKVDQIESYFDGIKSFVNQPQHGSDNLAVSILGQIPKFNLNFGRDLEEQVDTTSNYVTVRRFAQLTDINFNQNGFVSTFQNNTNYVASERNSIAHQMISSINGIDTLKAVTREELIAVYTRKTNPAPTEEMALVANELAFWSIDEGVQTQLTNLAEAGTEIPAARFIAIFGEETGVAIHAIYTEAIGSEENIKRLKEIVTLKNGLKNSVPTDATDAVKAVYDLSLDTLVSFLNGELTDDVIKYYQQNIVNLPDHRAVITN